VRQVFHTPTPPPPTTTTFLTLFRSDDGQTQAPSPPTSPPPSFVSAVGVSGEIALCPQSPRASHPSQRHHFSKKYFQTYRPTPLHHPALSFQPQPRHLLPNALPPPTTPQTFQATPWTNSSTTPTYMPPIPSPQCHFLLTPRANFQVLRMFPRLGHIPSPHSHTPAHHVAPVSRIGNLSSVIPGPLIQTAYSSTAAFAHEGPVGSATASAVRGSFGSGFISVGGGIGILGAGGTPVLPSLSSSQGSLPALGLQDGGSSYLSSFSEPSSGFMSDTPNFSRNRDAVRDDLQEISALFSPMSK
jgi:hypothetical protein